MCTAQVSHVHSFTTVPTLLSPTHPAKIYCQSWFGEDEEEAPCIAKPDYRRCDASVVSVLYHEFIGNPLKTIEMLISLTVAKINKKSGSRCAECHWPETAVPKLLL